MMELIQKKLAALPCEAWELTMTEEERWEFYFIGHKLDQNRAVKIRQAEVTVYVKTGDENGEGLFLGGAADVIAPTASEQEIDGILGKLLIQAALVKNPYYRLTDMPVTISPGTESVDVAQIAGECIRALAGFEESKSIAPGAVSSTINSYEIFVSGMTRHFLNSNGVEYSCSYPRTEMEVVVNARKGAYEIELHRVYVSGTCDRERLRRDIEEVMRYGRDRLKAEPTPRLVRGDVLFSTADAVPVFEYFVEQMHAEYVVRGLSSWKIGEPISEQILGDRVSVEALPELPNSSKNYPVDEEGSEIYRRWLIKDGIAENYCGSRQFSQYLGLDKSSQVTNWRVCGGTKKESEIRKGDYLEVVEFSDFQVDSMSGDIAGEIRLGYLHRGDTVQIVTGGSVSGSMVEAVRDMVFSEETVQYDNAEVPSVTLLRDLRITGI